MPAYEEPAYSKKFSNYYPSENLEMDVPLPTGGASFDQLLNDTGTGTTNATAGTTTAVTHNLGVVPNFITITETSNGVVYLDPANPPTATTFNVLGSAASLTFNWKVE